MTGYLQSKQEWLEQIDSGQMQYHSSQQRVTAIEITGDTGVLVGNKAVDATIRGSREPGTHHHVSAPGRRLGRRETIAITFWRQWPPPHRRSRRSPARWSNLRLSVHRRH
jgi:hypothetical protein